MNNFFRKLQALLWKNFKLKLRTPCKTICEIVAPAICVIVVMLLVLGIVLIADKPLKVKSGDTKFKSEVLKNIHYVKSSKYVTNIMKEMKNTLGNYTEKKINFYEHSDEGSLQTAMETGECIFAIIFEKGNILKETDRELKVLDLSGLFIVHYIAY
ncbi:hypothetical protein C0J52_07249 [Blattella germanica]|nr:hypothetical protein C0J52_07249 [Blattella germanica]